MDRQQARRLADRFVGERQRLEDGDVAGITYLMICLLNSSMTASVPWN